MALLRLRRTRHNIAHLKIDLRPPAQGLVFVRHHKGVHVDPAGLLVGDTKVSKEHPLARPARRDEHPHCVGTGRVIQVCLKNGHDLVVTTGEKGREKKTKEEKRREKETEGDKQSRKQETVGLGTIGKG